MTHLYQCPYDEIAKCELVRPCFSCGRFKGRPIEERSCETCVYFENERCRNDLVLCVSFGQWQPKEITPDLSKCPECGGPADNGHDRCVPPNPYVCAKCETTPEQRESDEQEAVYPVIKTDHKIYTVPTSKKQMSDADLHALVMDRRYWWEIDAESQQWEPVSVFIHGNVYEMECGIDRHLTSFRGCRYSLSPPMNEGEGE